MAHTWTSHVAHADMSCHESHATHTCHISDPYWAEFAEIPCEIAEDLEIAASQGAPLINTWISHVTLVNESCRTWKCVISQITLDSHMSPHTSDVCQAESEEKTCDIAEDLEIAASRDAPPSRMSHGTHMNVSCHTYEWVMSHMKMCHFTNHTWLTHLSNSYQAEFEEIMCEIPEDLEIAASRDAPLVLAFWSELVTETRSAGKNESRHACGLVTWHMWIIHVTHANESCHTCEGVMSHMNKVLVLAFWSELVTETRSAGKNESCHTREWVMSHLWMSHVTHVNESCHTCEWVMSHVWMSHITHVNKVLVLAFWSELVTCSAGKHESCHTCE